MFANKYLAKNNNVARIEKDAATEADIIIVIPCFREPEILLTLESLKLCDAPKSQVEVIILVNHSEVSTDEIKAYNKNTIIEIDSWIENNRAKEIAFYAVGPIKLKKKWAGAGVARKSGMDEAVRRFSELNKPDGIVVSLDADTLVEKNYLIEIEKHFRDHPKHVGATIDFEHQKSGLSKKQLNGIQLYEKYLDYYKRALDFTGYPHSMFTIGSAFAVRALAYVKRGGMNRRQAGEDFYFLQNLVQMGTVGEIITTTVYPSARLSDRVPFGTGPILQKWMSGEENLTLTYNFHAFIDLKKLFGIKAQLYKINESRFQLILKELPTSISAFIQHDNFWNELTDLSNNCSSLASFQSRFFQKFNAFKILKYINFVHDKFYEKGDLIEQIRFLNQEK